MENPWPGIKLSTAVFGNQHFFISLSVISKSRCHFEIHTDRFGCAESACYLNIENCTDINPMPQAWTGLTREVPEIYYICCLQTNFDRHRVENQLIVELVQLSFFVNKIKSAINYIGTKSKIAISQCSTLSLYCNCLCYQQAELKLLFYSM